MRTIKLRAWDRNKNTMFYGDLESWVDWDDNGLSTKRTNVVLMHYTGYKDKKRTKEFPDGQEIYEGDVIKFEGRNGEEIVEYMEVYSPEDCEVIGNKFENSELLKLK